MLVKKNYCLHNERQRQYNIHKQSENILFYLQFVTFFGFKLSFCKFILIYSVICVTLHSKTNKTVRVRATCQTMISLSFYSFIIFHLLLDAGVS